MRTVVSLIGCLALVILVSGCAPWEFRLIDGSDPQHPIFKLVKNSGPMPRGILVYAVDTREEMWTPAIPAYNVKSDSAMEITYGKLSKGMEQNKEAKPLNKNILYYILASSGDHGTHPLYFMMIEEDGKLMIRTIENPKKK